MVTKPEHIGVAAIVIGGAGVLIPILVLTGNSRVEVQLAVMVSGAILAGCGVIATAIALRK